jgi:hypothetical protein
MNKYWKMFKYYYLYNFIIIKYKGYGYYNFTQILQTDCRSILKAKKKKKKSFLLFVRAFSLATLSRFQ